MSVNVDRISLEERVNNLEQRPFSIQKGILGLDFDQYPDNAAKLLPEGLLIKCSVNVGDFDKSLSGFSFKVCLFTPRVLGFLGQEVLLLVRVSIDQSFKAPTQAADEYLVFPGLVNVSDLQKENLITLIYGLIGNGFAVGPLFRAPIGMNQPLSINGSISFDPFLGTLQFGAAYYTGARAGVSFLRGDYILGTNPNPPNVGGDLSLFLPKYFETDATNQNNVWNVNSPGDLSADIKPYFPASWSV